MKTKLISTLACGLLAAMASPQATWGATLFSETFDSAASSSNFVVTQIAGSADTVAFGYDYSANAIPEAPSTPGGAAAQRGLYVQANKPAGSTGATNGINVTAANGGIAINFAQVIRLSFDMWLNVPSQLTNTTEQALFGINTDGLGVNSRTGATQTGADGVWYQVANEGGYGNTSTTPNSRDVVNYINNTVPAGGRLDNGDPPFPALFPNSPPSPLVGTPGNGWVKVVVKEVGGNVVMSMNGVDVFNVPNSGPTAGSLFVGYQDPFSGSVGATSLFAIFDNVEVVPEPSSLALALVAVGGFLIRRQTRG